MISLPLLLTHEHACSYLDAQAQSLFVHPSCDLSSEIYAQLLAKGFRRSGAQVYRPHCPSCSACIPVRIPATSFTPNRSQQRVKAKNIDTRVTLQAPVFDPRHYQLYMNYQRHRHPGGGMGDANPENYLEFLRSDWCRTFFAEFSIAGELAAVAVVDRCGNALSAVYTFFDPRFAAFSPGVFAVLWQVQHAQSLGLEFVYLGYWIETCRKMAYKANYRPLQALLGGHWRELDKGHPIA